MHRGATLGLGCELQQVRLVLDAGELVSDEPVAPEIVQVEVEEADDLRLDGGCVLVRLTQVDHHCLKKLHVLFSNEL